MKDFRLDSDNSFWDFCCEDKETRGGFKHVCTVYKDGAQVATVARHYINRTWEVFTFQSVLRKAALAVCGYNRRNKVKRFPSEASRELYNAFDKEFNLDRPL